MQQSSPHSQGCTSKAKESLPDDQHWRDHSWCALPRFGLPAEDKCWHTGMSPVEDSCDGAQGIRGEVEGNGLVQPWEEEGKGRPHCCYNCLVGGYRGEEARLCLKMHSNRMRGNRHMLECGKIPLGIRKNFCNMRIVTILEQGPG